MASQKANIKGQVYWQIIFCHVQVNPWKEGHYIKRILLYSLFWNTITVLPWDFFCKKISTYSWCTKNWLLATKTQAWSKLAERVLNSKSRCYHSKNGIFYTNYKYALWNFEQTITIYIYLLFGVGHLSLGLLENCLKHFVFHKEALNDFLIFLLNTSKLFRHVKQ